MLTPALLNACTTRTGASPSQLVETEQRLGRSLPADYRAVLLQSDGLEGFVGEIEYLHLWSTLEIAERNHGYRVAEFAPGLILIGTNGGNSGYGFRTAGARLEYVEVPLVGMEPESVVALGQSFQEFLEHLARSQP